MYIHGTGKLHEKHRFNSFADIIESRDDSTGNHVKRTTAYVGIILKGMKRHNYYRGILTQGLADQDIPLCARIMAIADIFDAGTVIISNVPPLTPSFLRPLRLLPAYRYNTDPRRSPQ